MYKIYVIYVNTDINMYYIIVLKKYNLTIFRRGGLIYFSIWYLVAYVVLNFNPWERRAFARKKNFEFVVKIDISLMMSSNFQTRPIYLAY